ncbi:MAG: hypothetical protein IPM82_16350 [Saprospiraceae bacterium]|nr:hypothetical protein [Saprospiraceae bacterium]
MGEAEVGDALVGVVGDADDDGPNRLRICDCGFRIERRYAFSCPRGGQVGLGLKGMQAKIAIKWRKFFIFKWF